MVPSQPASSDPALWRDHPERYRLAGEIHARPFPDITPPVQVSHLAFVRDDAEAAHEVAHLAALCARYGAVPPAAGVRHAAFDFGGWRLRWEHHTEFSTYTVFVGGDAERPFDEPAVVRLPRDWLAGIVGQRLVAVHASVRAREAPDERTLARLFADNPVIGGGVVEGAALAFSDFQIHADGFTRILIHDVALAPGQAGRLLQRVLELETYRMMALLALPLAHQAAPAIAEIDRRLSALAARIGAIAGGEAEQGLLDDLTALAARIEGIIAANSFRFSASRAYFALVEARLAALREQRSEGRLPWGLFLERRITPAMRTCDSVARREEALSRRIARASDLLRTRVNVGLERQNRDLLASMDRRTAMQVRLQQMVEGLSVIAISYYAVGLIGYAVEGARGAGLALDKGLAMGLSVIPVLAAAWWAIRRLKKRIVKP